MPTISDVVTLLAVPSFDLPPSPRLLSNCPLFLLPFFALPSSPTYFFNLSTVRRAIFRLSLRPPASAPISSLFVLSFLPVSPSPRSFLDLFTVSPCPSVPRFFSALFTVTRAFFRSPSVSPLASISSLFRRAFFVLPPGARRLSDPFTALRAISLIPSVSSSFSQPLHYPSYLPFAHLI